MRALKSVLKAVFVMTFIGGIVFGVVMIADKLNRESFELNALKQEIRESCQREAQQAVITVLMYSRQYLGDMHQVYQMRVSALSAGRNSVLVSNDDSYEKVLGDISGAIESWIAGKRSEKSCTSSEEDLKKEARLVEIRAISKAIADLEKTTNQLFRAGPAEVKELQQEFKSKTANLRNLTGEVTKQKGAATS